MLDAPITLSSYLLIIQRIFMGDFRDLEIWQEAHKLTLKIYQLTSQLPKSEIFGLVSQSRRASVSVESNLVEGNSRYSKKDKIQFFVIARGSLAELKTQLLIIADLYPSLKTECHKLFEQYSTLEKRLNAFITYQRNQ